MKTEPKGWSLNVVCAFGSFLIRTIEKEKKFKSARAHHFQFFLQTGNKYIFLFRLIVTKEYRVSVLYFTTNVKSRFHVKTENFNTYFLLCRNHIFGMAFKGICINIFDKVTISDEKYTYKHTLSAKKIVNVPLNIHQMIINQPNSVLPADFKMCANLRVIIICMTFETCQNSISWNKLYEEMSSSCLCSYESIVLNAMISYNN